MHLPYSVWEDHVRYIARGMVIRPSMVKYIVSAIWMIWRRHLPKRRTAHRPSRYVYSSRCIDFVVSSDLTMNALTGLAALRWQVRRWNIVIESFTGLLWREYPSGYCGFRMSSRSILKLSWSWLDGPYLMIWKTSNQAWCIGWSSSQVHPTKWDCSLLYSMTSLFQLQQSETQSDRDLFRALLAWYWLAFMAILILIMWLMTPCLGSSFMRRADLDQVILKDWKRMPAIDEDKWAEKDWWYFAANLSAVESMNFIW